MTGHGGIPEHGLPAAGHRENGIAITEEMFSGIVSNSSDAIITVDESQRIVNFNVGAETIFGWAPEEIVGMPLDVLLPERFRAVHRDHLKRFAGSPVTARRMGERQEISGLRRNGIEFPADASILKTRVAGEMLFTVVLRDITDRKRAERSQDLLVRAGDLLGTSLDLPATLRNIVRIAVPTLADWQWCTSRTREAASGARTSVTPTRASMSSCARCVTRSSIRRVRTPC
jgi:PAS domain S-box-containing protein